jgi:predicted  nucleic acid-binding Zn-ribbon protein
MAQLSQSRGDDDIRLQLQEIGERMRAGEGVQDRLDDLTKRVTANDNEARAVREHMALLDQRLTNVSTELANQLSELGRDIDGLGQRIPEVAQGTVSEELVETLRGGQVKLASEQARYEIAFRQDLAALAEQLRHTRSDSRNGTPE